MEADSQEILNVCAEMGRILLENGAEIFRTEDTLSRVARHYGADNCDFFVLTNGILSSATDRKGTSSARVRFIPSTSSNLEKVEEVNRLSRRICSEEELTLDDVKKELERIDSLHSEPEYLIVAATGLSSFTFALLYRGTLPDAVIAASAGLVLGFFLEFFAKRHLSKITKNLSGAAIVTLICLTFHHYGLSDNMNAMIAGSIIPLIPGVTFVNGIRDIARGDYLSGVVRLLDSLFVFLCIAVGVGTVLAVFSRFRGGLNL